MAERCEIEHITRWHGGQAAQFHSPVVKKRDTTGSIVDRVDAGFRPAIVTIFRTCFPAVSSLSLGAIRSSRPFAMPTARWFWGGLVALVALTARCPGQIPLLPDYKIGDFATNEIITPMQLIVTDPERTEQLRQEQAELVPPIYLFHASASDEVESNLRFTFTRAREKFLDALEGAYQRR